MDEIEYLSVAEGRDLALRRRAGQGPTLLFLPGYMSDMEGGKASALDDWAALEGRAMLRFDYGGCGRSQSDFSVQTLFDWRDDALAVIDQRSEGPLVLVGSSMGGWLMLLLALARPERVKALVGIAAAPDFTDWGFTEAQKNRIREEGRLEEISPYGELPYVTHRAFWESGERLLLLSSPIDFCGPVRLLHGQMDEDVPWQLALDLAGKVRSDDVQLILIKDGDHRLSRPGDIALLKGVMTRLMEQLDE